MASIFGAFFTELETGPRILSIQSRCYLDCEKEYETSALAYEGHFRNFSFDHFPRKIKPNVFCEVLFEKISIKDVPPAKKTAILVRFQFFSQYFTCCTNGSRTCRLFKAL